MPNLVTGGGQKVVLEYLRHADRDRFDARVAFISRAGDLAPEFEASGPPPAYLDYERGQGVRNSLRLARYVRNEGIDLLHVHGGITQRYGQSAALVTGTPIVAHLHSTWTAKGVSPRQVRAWAADRGLARIERHAISHYIACTDAVRRVYEPFVRAPITVVDNGVAIPSDAQRTETRARIRSSLGLDRNARLVLSVGVLEPRKRIDTLIAMMSRLARDHGDAVLVVAGEGPERSRLERQVAEAGLEDRVHLLGNRHDVADLMLAADVFAFASEREGLPVAVLEAMAAGLAMVSSRLPAIEELVQDGVDGVLVETGDAAGFAAAVDKLLRDQSAAHDIGSAARRRIAARFDAADMAKSFEAVYDHVLGRSAEMGPRPDRREVARGVG